MIKVLLTRRVKRHNYPRVIGLLTDLRAAAMRQPGYVTGETIVKGEDLMEVLAIGTWVGEEYWKAWSTSQARIEIEAMIDPLLEAHPDVAVYHPAQEDSIESLESVGLK